MRLWRAAGLLLVLAILACLYAYYRVARPYKNFAGTIYVDLPKGTTTRGMATELERAGVIGSRWDFWLARLLNRGRTLEAGEYAFSKAEPALDVVRRIERGDIFYFELLVPEGKNMFDIASQVEQLGVFQGDAFLKAARDPALIRDLDPQAPSLEGYLFPSAYRLNHRTTPAQLCRMMTDRFRSAWRGLNSDANLHQIVTLASLVEKEGKLEEERPLIAAVFTNRLRIGMKLDCDPTTIYAAELLGVYRGTIFRSDLDRDDPYNTYRHSGLPPGPIANPGVPSLKAALHPAESDALYFVKRPDDSGGHEFSTSLAAHTHAVEKYRHGSRQFR